MRRASASATTLELTAAGRAVPFVIAGTLPGVAEDQSIGVVDIAEAQWRFDADRTAASRRSEARAGRRRRAHAERHRRTAARRCGARQPGERSAAHRQPVARLSRQSRHAGADGASDRRVPGLFGAVAFGRAPAGAVRAVARARRLSPRAGRARCWPKARSSALSARSRVWRSGSCSPMRGCASWAAISAAAISAARGPS